LVSNSQLPIHDSHKKNDPGDEAGIVLAMIVVWTY
jgi:hypothetical protein